MVTCQQLGLLILLFLDTTSASSCSQYCVCSPPDHGPVKMNCSFKELVVLPLLPNSIQELYLQNNKLETIWAGAFDNIPLLQIINLSSNPWHCDCGILYLKNWLKDHKGLLLTGDIRCSTPPSLNKRLVSELKRSDLPSCSRPQIHCSSFLFNDAAIFFLMLILFLLLIGIMLSIKRTQLNVEVCNNSTTVPGILPSTSDQLKSRAGRLTSNSSLLGTPVH